MQIIAYRFYPSLTTVFSRYLPDTNNQKAGIENIGCKSCQVNTSPSFLYRMHQLLGNHCFIPAWGNWVNSRFSICLRDKTLCLKLWGQTQGCWNGNLLLYGQILWTTIWTSNGVCWLCWDYFWADNNLKSLDVYKQNNECTKLYYLCKVEISITKVATFTKHTCGTAKFNVQLICTTIYY